MNSSRYAFFPVVLLAGLSLFATGVAAEPTRVSVKVLAKDAKFIGTGMGGARVVIRDLESGQELASGITAGGTGNTGLIMESAHQRNQPLGDGAAGFSATLDLDRPVKVEISAEGPLSLPESMNRVNLTQWLLPGKHLESGDGLVLEIPGFALQALEPVNAGALPAAAPVNLSVRMVMMCGCPITPGGLWDADQIEISASLSREGEHLGDYPLSYAGQVSQFGVSLPASGPGRYEAVISAYDTVTGNTGLLRVPFTVAGK